jgi:CTP:phosphocholine cytidylyltransferase-like protein
MSKKTVLSIMIVIALSLGLMACKTSDPKEEPQPDVESVEITNSELTLTPGTYQITTRALPEASVQLTRLTLLGNPEGISITDHNLVISVNAADETVFTVRVTSIYDPMISSTTEFTVINEGSDSVEISTEEQLQAIGNDVESLSKKYILMNDIVLTKPFEPIGESDVEDDYGNVEPGVYFTGYFDGNGYTISGIDIQKEGEFTVGFFAQIDSTGVVRNTVFEGNLISQGWSGGVAGINSGLIENVVTNINVEVLGGSAGAFVSVNRGTIRDSYAIGQVVAGVPNTQSRSTGLVAANEGQLQNVFGDFERIGTTNYVAFDPTQNTNQMLNTENMKKAATYAEWNEAIWFIEDGFYPILRFAGFVEPTEPEASISITNSESSIDVENLVDWTFQINASIVNNNGYSLAYSLEEAVTGVSIDSETGLLTVTDDVVNLSTIKVVVKLVEDETVSASKVFTLMYNPVPDEETIEIRTEADLINLATTNNPELLGKEYLLMNNIVLEAWYLNAIGSAGTPFTGIFDGQGFTISGFKGGDGQHNFGFFGVIGETGIVRNLGIIGADREADMYVGSASAVVASENHGLIENVFANVTILSTGEWVSGFVFNNVGTIRNSISLSIVMKSDNVASFGPGFTSSNTGTIEYSFVDGEYTSAISFNHEDDAYDIHLLTTAELKMIATFAEWDSNIWYLVDGSYPALKYDGYVPTEPEVEIEINNSNSQIDLDELVDMTFDMDVTILENDNYTLVFSLEDAVTGVSIDSETGVLTFTEEVANQATITVIVKLVEDETVTASKVFTIINHPVPTEDTIEIATEQDLLDLASSDNPEILGKDYILMNDIELTGWYLNSIGSTTIPFTGTFDGQGFTISGIKGGDGQHDFGFFGDIGVTGIVRNLGLVGAGGVSDLYVGGGTAVVAANNYGLIENVFADVSIVSTGNWVSGFVANNHGTISNSYSLSRVMRNEDPTVIGPGFAINNLGTIINSFVDGDLSEAVTFLNAESDLDLNILTTAEMQTVTTYDGWDTAIWNIVDGEYPTFK